jgi:lactoylglutathione lyase
MKVDHLAIWVDDLELMRKFSTAYFDVVSSEKYTNEKNGFTSYFLMLGEDKTRIQIMHKQGIKDCAEKRGLIKGLAHFAISLGSKDAVDVLTERLRNDNYIIESEPRKTGGGNYESVILDPEGNCIELSD